MDVRAFFLHFQVVPILCHKLVLCSFIQPWQSIIDNETEEVIIPDLEHDRLKKFVDALYESLTGEVNSVENLDQDISSILGLNPSITILESKTTLEPFDLFPMKADPEFEIDEDFEDAMDIFNEDEISDSPYKSDSTSEGSSSSDEDFEYDPRESKQKQGKRKLLVKEELQSRNKRRIRFRSLPTKSDLVRADNYKAIHEPKEPQLLIDYEDKLDLLKQHKSSGSLHIDMTTSHVNLYSRVGRVGSLSERKDAFFALLGVARENDQILGRSLTWTSDDPKIIEACFLPTLEAFQTVFGFARGELLRGKCFISFAQKKDKKSAKHAFSDLHQKFVHEFTREDLEQELKRVSNLNNFVESTPKRCKLDFPMSDYSIQMTTSLTDFQDIVLVGVYKHGVELRSLNVLDDYLETIGPTCSRLLTLVWVGGSDQLRFPEVPSIHEMAYENIRLKYSQQKIQRLLATDEIFPRYLPTITCQICGKIFNESKASARFREHLLVHKVEDFRCDCIGHFTTFAQKKKHYLDEHSGVPRKKGAPKKGSPVKKRVRNDKKTEQKAHVCELCGDVLSSSTALESHHRQRHLNIRHICELCGKDVCSQGSLHRHIRRKHIHCPHCTVDFASAPDFIAHWKKLHPDLEMNLPKSWGFCHHCDAVFKTKFQLRRHISAVHGTDEDRPYKCGPCDKTFVVKPTLKQHVLNLHLKTRPFLCRSPGCAANFNHLANLYAHERKLHGQNFGPSTPLDVAVTDEHLLELGCRWETGPSKRSKAHL